MTHNLTSAASIMNYSNMNQISDENVFRGIASVAGIMFESFYNTCDPSRYKNDLIRQRRRNRGTKEMQHLCPIVVFYTADLSSPIIRFCNTTHLHEKS
jgi:hypothetical protein